MTAIVVKAYCERCLQDLVVGEKLKVNGCYMLVVQPCSNPKCKEGPRQGRVDGRAGVAEPAQNKR